MARENELAQLKVLLVIDRLTNPHAGTEGQFILLIEQLQLAGVEVSALVLGNSEWLSKNKLSCPVSLIGSSSIKNPLNWINVFLCARAYKKRGYKLAHIFFNDASVICPPMFTLAGLKTLISRRDMGFWYSGLYRALLPITGKFVDGVLSNSHAVSKVTQTVEKISPQKLHVIYNGYNRMPCEFLPVPELECLTQSGAILLGLVANIRPIKRIEDPIRALATLYKEFPNVQLVIIGSGDASTLIGLADELGVAARVHFLGGRGDIPDCLEYLSAGLLCSESEGFSNAIIEYQYSGLPVICSYTGGNPEAVSHGVTGWLYPVGDIAALTLCLRELLQDLHAAKQMGLRAQAIARERYAVDKMTANHIELYRELLAE